MIVNINGRPVDLSKWFEDGRIQQAKVLDDMIERYFIKLKMQQTLKLIEKILNDKCN